MKRKYIAAVSIGFIALCLYGVFVISVDNDLTQDDIKAIASLGVDDSCVSAQQNFSSQVACVKAIQEAVQSIGSRKCAGWGEQIEPPSFLARDYGCCFDRARFIEKAARHYGFETRHIFLIAPKDSFGITNILPLGQSSHATSEVLTQKGWMGVDSNESFIIQDDNGAPMGYRTMIDAQTLPDYMVPEAFYQEDLDVIYGLYSRHGFFFGLNFPGPELHFSEFSYNF